MDNSSIKHKVVMATAKVDNTAQAATKAQRRRASTSHKEVRHKATMAVERLLMGSTTTARRRRSSKVVMEGMEDRLLALHTVSISSSRVDTSSILRPLSLEANTEVVRAIHQQVSMADSKAIPHKVVISMVVHRNSKAGMVSLRIPGGNASYSELPNGRYSFLTLS